MIHLSTKLLDLPFVAGLLRKNKLNNRPVDGFHTMQDYWTENGRWKRVVERYEWGAIVYASDRQRNEHFTAVIEGEFDIQTGRAVWELPQTGTVNSWGGVLSTAGGVVLFGEDSGAFMAADAATGKPLWSFQTSALWKASPMTYLFDQKQYVAVAAGSSIIAFGLPD